MPRPRTAQRARPRPPLRAALLAALALLASLALAQRPPEADALLSQAREAAARGRATERLATPDAPGWREAIRLGEEARALAPRDPELLRFLAVTYSDVGWFVRAWAAWTAWLEEGGTLSAEPGPGTRSDLERYADAAVELGFARYEADRPEAALPFFEALLGHLPDHPEALTWVGRIHLEAGRPERALPYWQRLAELRPDDPNVAFHLALAEEELAAGPDASRAYRAGIAAYEAGRLEDAFARFGEAVGHNAAFADAQVWRARTALELGRPETAAREWRRVLELRPDDERAAYFLELAEAQARWGVVAAGAFYQGQAAYEVGDVSTAAEHFARAADAAPAYLDAWVWAARTHQEAGRFGEAVRYWRGVLERDPEDARARWFLTLSEQQLEHGRRAGAAYAEAQRRYDLGDVTGAEEKLGEAVTVAPAFVEAWSLLGRIRFLRGAYAEAASAYERAAELAPDDPDLAFFAAEARRLAGGPGSGGAPDAP